jgi:hypothetical protein
VAPGSAANGAAEPGQGFVGFPPMFPRWPAIVVVLLALSGCATSWSRPATSPREFTLDNRACQHMNLQLVVRSSVPVGEYVAPSGYRRCMLEEGYTEGGSWKGSSGWRDE